MVQKIDRVMTWTAILLFRLRTHLSCAVVRELGLIGRIKYTAGII